MPIKDRLECQRLAEARAGKAVEVVSSPVVPSQSSPTTATGAGLGGMKNTQVTAGPEKSLGGNDNGRGKGQ